MELKSELLIENTQLASAQLLTEIAQNDDLISLLETAFGTDFSLENSTVLRQEWLSNNFLDDLKIIASRELDGALGAYAAANNTIYFSSEFLETGTPEEITAVFLEEYGHAIDSRFNSIDSPGDEGAIFSALVRQETLSDHQLNALRTEDDTTEIVVNGEPILVEQATFNVTNLNDSGAGSLRDAINQANSDAVADTITFDAALSGGTINLSYGEFPITEAVTITGPGADQLTIDAGGSSRVFNVDDGSEYSLTNVSISDVTITGGSAVAYGAGIFNKEDLTITNSVISGNTAFDSGGGIYNATPSYTESDGGTLTLVNSTISGNDASYRGGGIYNNNTATVTNSTIAQNYAGYGGGGLFNNGEAILNQATIAQNQISTSGVGEGIYNNANLALVNSIVAGHSDGDIYDSGTVITTGNNIVQDGSITGVITGDPLLDPAGLQNNGGSTPTIALQGGSPAIDAGDNTVIPADTLDEDGDSDTGDDIPFDQRGTGFDRVINVTVDIGAFEAEILVVDTLVDEDDGIGTGDISLRDAIAEIDPGGIITFDSGLADGTIDLSTSGLGELVIDKSLTIDGESNNITIDGGNSSRIFNVDDGYSSAIDVLISDVTMTNGNSGDNGGGILNRENLTVSNSTISNSYATDIGGGVINYGEITLTNSTVSGNDAGIDGGGISNQGSATATLTNSTISGNNATAGAGLINAGNLTLNFSTISGNNATNNGGGVYNYNSGDLTLNTSIISGNSATNSGGGMYNAATATLNSSTVSGNNADDDGGGLYVGSGYGVLNLNNSTVSGNYAASFGGGLLISGGYGYEASFYAATANLSNSTVYGNTAYSGGGGLYNYGGAATINSSTIAGNSADSAISGGGILTGSKYANETYYDSTTTLESAIVADNNANGSPDDIQGPILVDASFSLIENGGFTDNGNNISATDPQFDPEGLKRNGGFVETIALESGSPAIDVGSNPDGLSFDQRGKNFDRVINSQADIGAFEFQDGANTSSITVELQLREDDGGTPGNLITDGNILGSSFFLEVLVQDGRGSGVVSTTYDLTYDSNLVDNGDDFSSITDTTNSLLTSNFPVFRGGTIDNAAGTITGLGASAVDGEQGSAIRAGTPERLSLLTFSEDTTRTASNFTFDLTIDPGQIGFADGVFADPSAINFSQNVTLNNAPVPDPIADPDIAENAVATDIVLNGSDITATDDGLGNEVELSLTTVDFDGSGNPLFSFFDSSQTGAARFVSTSTVSDNFPVVVTPAGEAVLDFETTKSYNLGITASDGFKPSTEETFTVNVTDVAPTIAVSQPSITFGTPLSQFREGATDSDLVRPAFPDIFKSLVITNTLSGAIENNDRLTIDSFGINATNVSITSGNVPAGGDILLNPGESHRVDLQYAPTAEGESFDVPNGFVINSDAGNNPALEVSLAGQSTFNSDVDYSGNESLGAVDLNDLAVLETLPFGSTVGDAGYDPTADINGDGNINRGEIVVLNGELFQSL